MREFGVALQELNFEYNDKKDRLFHPLQNIRSTYRKTLFANHGLNHNYDIECCAPTLIHQFAQKQSIQMDSYLFALRKYLTNRTAVRRQLSEEVELDVSVIKVMINALFSGAKWGFGPNYAISIILGHDRAKFDFLSQHVFLNELKADIKVCWEYIKPSMATRYITTIKGDISRCH